MAATGKRQPHQPTFHTPRNLDGADADRLPPPTARFAGITLCQSESFFLILLVYTPLPERVAAQSRLAEV